MPSDIEKVFPETEVVIDNVTSGILPLKFYHQGSLGTFNVAQYKELVLHPERVDTVFNILPIQSKIGPILSDEGNNVISRIVYSVSGKVLVDREFRDIQTFAFRKSQAKQYWKARAICLHYSSNDWVRVRFEKATRALLGQTPMAKWSDPNLVESRNFYSGFYETKDEMLAKSESEVDHKRTFVNGITAELLKRCQDSPTDMSRHISVAYDVVIKSLIQFVKNMLSALEDTSFLRKNRRSFLSQLAGIQFSGLLPQGSPFWERALEVHWHCGHIGGPWLVLKSSVMAGHTRSKFRVGDFKPLDLELDELVDSPASRYIMRLAYLLYSELSHLFELHDSVDYIITDVVNYSPQKKSFDVIIDGPSSLDGLAELALDLRDPRTDDYIGKLSDMCKEKSMAPSCRHLGHLLRNSKALVNVEKLGSALEKRAPRYRINPITTNFLHSGLAAAVAVRQYATQREKARAAPGFVLRKFRDIKSLQEHNCCSEALEDIVFEESRVNKTIWNSLHDHIVAKKSLDHEEDSVTSEKVDEICPMPLGTMQREAVRRSLSRRISIVQGPPGSGKTYTATAICWALYKAFPTEQILVISPSNIAVANVYESVKTLFENQGVPAGKAYHGKAFLNSTKGEIKARRRAVSVCSILFTTTIHAAAGSYADFSPSTLIVDEASMATELELLPSLVKGPSRLVLIGDPAQLPAFYSNPELSFCSDELAAINVSLQERLMSTYNEYIMLNVQRRMHRSIAYWPSMTFYKGLLQTAPDLERLNQIDPNEIVGMIFPNPAMRVVVVKVENMETQPKRPGGEAYNTSLSNPSISNSREADVTVRVVEHLLLHNPDKTISCITPYKQQMMMIRNSLQNPEQIEVNTVDGFQGRERDIIVVSTVRCNPRGLVGFLDDERRMNVMLTRARRTLIVIMSVDTFANGKSSLWRNWVRWAIDNKLVTEPRNLYTDIPQTGEVVPFDVNGIIPIQHMEEDVTAADL